MCEPLPSSLSGKQPQLSCRIADSLSHQHRESHLAQTGHNSPSSQREPWSFPPAPKPALASFPLYSEPAPLQQSQGGWSQAPPWGEGRGAQGKDEAWRGAHRPRSQQGREVEPFPIMSYRGCRLSPGDPTWASQYRFSDPSVKGGVGGEQPQTWLISSPSAPHTPNTLPPKF